jgi:hypothetical protein
MKVRSAVVEAPAGGGTVWSTAVNKEPGRRVHCARLDLLASRAAQTRHQQQDVRVHHPFPRARSHARVRFSLTSSRANQQARTRLPSLLAADTQRRARRRCAPGTPWPCRQLARVL